mgnify:CR=1 FL=1
MSDWMNTGPRWQWLCGCTADEVEEEWTDPDGSIWTVEMWDGVAYTYCLKEPGQPSVGICEGPDL